MDDGSGRLTTAEGYTYVVRDAVRRDAAGIVNLWREMMELHAAYDLRFTFAPGAEREVERFMVDAMRSPRQARLLVAESEGQIVGYVLGNLASPSKRV